MCILSGLEKWLWFRAPAAFAENLGSVPSINTVAHKHHITWALKKFHTGYVFNVTSFSHLGKKLLNCFALTADSMLYTLDTQAWQEKDC